MSTENDLDELDFDEWKTMTAVVRTLSARLKELEDRARVHLIDGLRPGESENAMLGERVAAQIGVSRGGEAKPYVKDVPAFGAWLHEHDAPNMSVQAWVPASEAMKTDYLNGLVKAFGGELPAGVEMRKPRPDTVRVTLEKGILDEPLDLSLVPVIGRILSITAPRPAESAEEDESWQ